MMKQAYKRLFTLLLTAVIALSLVPALTFAQENTRAGIGGEQTEHMATGYIPVQIPGTRAVSDAYARGDMETYYRLTGRTATRDTLPAKYDSRNYGYVTSVKNQNPYGSCWAHAALASIESYMIKHSIPVGAGSAATTSLNLSETQHCFFTYTSAYDAGGMLTGDKTILQGDNCMNIGGNGEKSCYTLMRWTGAADESVSALQYSKSTTVITSGLDSQYAYNYNICHVQNSEWVPGTSIDDIKRAIMKYGAGEISFYEDNDYNSYICTIDNTSQDSPSHKWANHAITVVGWDDTIAVSKFSPNKPTNPGAWICKNSWGSSMFDGGYCYISYEDTTMNEGYIEFFDAEPVDNYDHNYQYDGTCNVASYGKGWNDSTEWFYGFANDTQVANVFTSKGAETLRAIAFCNWDEAMTYTVEIFRNPSVGNPSSGTLMATQTGFLTYSGYYTIPLDTPVSLNYGDTFSIVISQHVPVADDNGCYVHTPYDATSSVYSSNNWIHADHGNTSYYKEPNGSWTDCPENGDYRIKAYTDDVLFNVTAESNNDTWGTVSVSGKSITAHPAVGYYAAGYEIVSGTASVAQDGNTFYVSPSSDCTVRIIFRPRDTAVLTFSVPEGVSCPPITDYAGDAVTLPVPEGTITVMNSTCTFLGWTTEPVEGRAAEMPAFIKPGSALILPSEGQTLYALYSYDAFEGSKGRQCSLVECAPTNWEGDYIIAYGGTRALDASGANSDAAVGGTSAVVDLATVGVDQDGTLLNFVPDSVLFHIAPDVYGAYTVKMKHTDNYLAVSSNTGLLTTTKEIKNASRWKISVGNDGVALTNVLYPSKSLQYSESGNQFGAFPIGEQTAISLYSSPEGTTWFTTDPTGKGGIPVSIVTQPVAQTVAAGKTVTFSVETVGDGVTYQWWYKAPGKEWTKVKVNGTSAAYTLTTEPRHDGYKYRCRVYNAAGKDASSIVNLTVVTTPVITSQPAAQTVTAGKTATFSVEATGGGLTYQWWYKAPGGEWTKVKVNGTSATYTLTAQERHNGYKYRCRVYNAAGVAASTIVKLTVVTQPTITTQPKSKTVNAGETASFTVNATGGGLSYQWWYLKPGATEWVKVKVGGTSATYNLTAEARHNGYQYKCVITNAAGSVTSKTVKLTVS